MGHKAPKGYILKCYGDITKIPPDWALCDGTKGTPNLPRKTNPTKFYIMKL